ncbi:MAG TPA: Na+/H+ antiporter NhaC family protein [Clostridia bacterium]|nr:Na+/H+ antiporter NhaC family protein [Clostridia bacterium]
MEAVSVGWLSILPPIIAIGLALITKEVISSLMIGVLSGTLIYTVATGGNLVVDTLKSTFTLMGSRFDLNIILFLALVGALVSLITMAGGSRSYGALMNKKLNSRSSAMLATGGLGVLIFIDDYCNCLTVGAVMKPVTDRFKISRAKLAYIIDATAAPVCIIAPISSWGAAVISSLPENSHMFDSGIHAMVATIPFNLYALLSIVMLIALSVTNLDFGPMARSEARALKGNLGAIDVSLGEDVKVSDRGTVWDLIIPVVVLILVSGLAMLENGGYFEGGMTLAEGFGNCSSGPALVLGSFAALVWSFVQFVPRKLMTAREFMGGITEGIKSMVPADIILVLAWTISGVCRDLLMTGDFVSTVVEGSNIPIAVLPAVTFAIAAGLSFSMGTSWGTFGILIPIVFSICESVAPSLIIPALAASLAGSVFGDHCSPISDTTIMASAGAGCDHIEHVSTQLPYCILVAICCFAGYLVAGFTNGNLLLTLTVSVLMLLGLLVLLHKKFGTAE